MLPLVLVGAGLAVGLLVGRWWALAACVALGVAVGVTEELEVDGAWLGLGYAVLSAAGTTAGVLVRRRLRGRRS